jgi:hypothetical protein
MRLIFWIIFLFCWGYSFAQEIPEWKLSSHKKNTLLHWKWKDFQGMLPFNSSIWKVEFGDVHGDSTLELLVGVTKTTKFDPVLRKRIFIFKWNEKQFVPLWLGSRWGNEILDFNIHPFQIIQTKEVLNQQQFIRYYRVLNFGIERLEIES